MFLNFLCSFGNNYIFFFLNIFLTFLIFVFIFSLFFPSPTQYHNVHHQRRSHRRQVSVPGWRQQKSKGVLIQIGRLSERWHGQPRTAVAREALKAGVPSRSGSLPRGWRSPSVPCSTHRGSWGSVLLEGGRLAGLDGLAGPLWDRELLLLLLTGELLASRLGGLLGGLLGGRLAGQRGCLLGTMSLFLLPDGLGLGSVRHHHLEPLPHEPVPDLWMNLHHVGRHPVAEGLSGGGWSSCCPRHVWDPRQHRLRLLRPLLQDMQQLPHHQASCTPCPLLVLLLVPSPRGGGACGGGSGGSGGWWWWWSPLVWTTWAVAAAEPAAWTALLIWKDKK